MTFARDDGPASDGHARRGRHDLTPIIARIVAASRRRPKPKAGFGATGSLSNAPALDILMPTVRSSSSPTRPGASGSSSRSDSNSEGRGGPGPPLSRSLFALIQRMACAARRISSARGCMGPKSGTVSRAPPCTRISAAPVSVSFVSPDFTSSIASSNETQSRIRIA